MPDGTVKPFLVSLVEPVAYLKSELLSRRQPAPVSPLAARLMDLPASVANKRFTAALSSLDATQLSVFAQTPMNTQISIQYK